MARVVTGAKKGTSHNKLYEECNWNLLSERRHNVKIKFMHKIVNNNVPEYLSNLLPNRIGDDIQYCLRNVDNIQQFHCRTEKFKKSLDQFVSIKDLDDPNTGPLYHIGKSLGINDG